MGAGLQAAVGWLLPAHTVTATIIAFVMVVIISYGFELFSKITGLGHYEVMDAVAAIIGGVAGMGGALLLL